MSTAIILKHVGGYDESDTVGSVYLVEGEVKDVHEEYNQWFQDQLKILIAASGLSMDKGTTRPKRGTEPELRKKWWEQYKAFVKTHTIEWYVINILNGRALNFTEGYL